jgi:hypothetical protein
MYASFLGFCAPYIWTFLNSLLKIEFFNKLLSRFIPNQSNAYAFIILPPGWSIRYGRPLLTQAPLPEGHFRRPDTFSQAPHGRHLPAGVTCCTVQELERPGVKTAGAANIY